MTQFSEYNRSDILIEDRTTSSVIHTDYISKIRNSKFCLVPEGHVSTALRLFEVIVANCVPVIVSDCMDLPFEGAAPVGDYSTFSVIIPVSSNPDDIMRRLDTVVSSGEYSKMTKKLSDIWPFFAMHNGSLNQPSASHLIIQQLQKAVQKENLPCFASEKRRRTLPCSRL